MNELVLKNEKEKMLAGELYDASDPELVRERLRARELLLKFNQSPPEALDLRRRLLGELLGRCEEPFWIEPPFYCDYGYNILAGSNVYFNFNCVVLDVCPVSIGRNVMFGPAVQIYTATHPIDSVRRAQGLEFGRPITIGDDVWVGGGAIIYPGVSIGDRAIIAAGAIITKDVAEAVLVGGNPAQVLKEVI